jgi:hypothetical protein
MKMKKPRMPINYAHVGKVAQGFRKANRILLSEVAHELGFDIGNLSKHEAGKRIWSEELFDRYTDAVEKIAGK